VSDYVYDEEAKRWVAVNDGNGVTAEAKSSYIPVNKAFEGETLEVSLGITDTTNATTLVTVCIEFYQKSGGNYYLLREGACGKVIKGL
jgi:hypothetical protein